MLVIWTPLLKMGFTRNIAGYYQGFFKEKRGFSTGKAIYPQPVVDIKNWKIQENRKRGYDNYLKPKLQAG
jgi:hypothetical protein